MATIEDEDEKSPADLAEDEAEGEIEEETPGLGLATQPESAPRAPKRTRNRIERLRIDKKVIADRVIRFYDRDQEDRVEDMEARLQRIAKFRMWTEGKDWPWENASDAAIPDMMTHSLKVQDTLHNAVMSTRPSVVAKATLKANKEKEVRVGELLDHQFFVEAPGEHTVGEMADAFVNDGVMTIFTPWITEDREVHEMHTLDPIPQGQEPEIYFDTHLRVVYDNAPHKKRDPDGWSWEVLDRKADKWFDVEFYTVGDKIEMDALRRQRVFDGPRPIVKDYEDILAPARCANLQIPSPSNPGGAAHAIVVDYPTLDEIKRLKKSRYYDIPDEEVERLERTPRDSGDNQAEKEQKDAFQGVKDNPEVNTGTGDGQSFDHQTYTRLTCFDVFDIDGDGVNEDVIFTVIKETKQLVRVRELTQVYPFNPPRRPFSEAQFIPVRGRRAGISLLEMIEGLHDIIKQFADMTIDGGTLKTIPFGFYRASGNMRPEVMRMWPGELYPLADPKNDVVFPQMPNDGGSFGFNLMSLLSQMEERLTNQGDLQFGRVPQGKSSALRTARGMQAVMGQGDARPERILRRFFIGLTDVYSMMHQLNQAFLPKEKKFRLMGAVKRNEDPYREIGGPEAIRGAFQFDFTANALNTSKDAVRAALDEIAAMFLNPLALQLGVVTPDGAYQLYYDMAKSRGADPDKYLTPPSPEANLPKLFAEEVMSLILTGGVPESRPAEATTMEHLQKLMEFASRDEFGYLSRPQVEVYKGYLVKVRQRLAAEAEKQALMEAAKAGPGGMPGMGAPPGPEGSVPPDAGNPMLQPNELLDESLPGAGGGGNPGPMGMMQ